MRIVQIRDSSTRLNPRFAARPSQKAYADRVLLDNEIGLPLGEHLLGPRTLQEYLAEFDVSLKAVLWSHSVTHPRDNAVGVNVERNLLLVQQQISVAYTQM